MADIPNSATAASPTGTREVPAIARYRRARERARRARSIVSLLVLGVVSVNAVYLVLSTRTFFLNESDELAAELAVQAQPIAIRHLPQIEQAMLRLAPRYFSAMKEMIDRELPPLELRLRRILAALEHRASAKWPDIQLQVNAVLRNREADFRTHLLNAVGREVPDEEIRGILEQYHREVSIRLQREFFEAYGQHKAVIDEIEHAVRQMSKAEPDLNRAVNLQEAAGLLIEFTGVEIQSKS